MKTNEWRNVKWLGDRNMGAWRQRKSRKWGHAGRRMEERRQKESVMEAKEWRNVGKQKVPWRQKNGDMLANRK